MTSVTPLEAIIHTMIAEQGALSLGQFTDIALAHPEHGYYMTRDPFGVAGDFVTAPEISQIFGELIGAWVADLWMSLGQPLRLNLVECGAGRGTFMADIMRVCATIPALGAAISLHLLDISPVLRAAQKAQLSAYDPTWVDDITAVNSAYPTIVIGNEFLDALPVEQVKRTQNGWVQCYITSQDGRLVKTWQAADQDILSLLPRKTESHQIYEVSPARVAFINDVCDVMKACPNAVSLWIDYGYRTRHHGDTVQAVQAHKPVDVLANIGTSDITSHVDFDGISDVVVGQKLSVSSLKTQAEFLTSLGVFQRADYLKAISKNPKKIEQDVDRLVSQNHMGNLFKVLCFHHNISFHVAGF